ncbi:MAG: OmpH family outer membrane protein [Sulfitobacter sp. SK025]|jgi:Skp family chaperone for outer membrane proteins|nr:hypothetical protein [Roseobacter sp.]MBV47097.1 hypothetical protein [Roseobacter sp.]THF72746.1 MAG: OmpH family outer membrane protein [Sulfitobacter sp. SK025]|tara:strand:+ start:2905 stop:3468 length:564 start_codon:yes stop_codon:yes gene_type:complete
MRWIFFAVILVPVLSLWAMPGQAQQGSMTQRERLTVQSPILTIDSDRIFNESAFGLRVARDVEVQSAGLAAENRKIEAELEAEEKRLTEQRSTLDAAAFRDLADAFDQKVQKTRAAQAAKGRSLSQMVDQERSLFLNAAGPVLEELMQDAGAAVILERLSVFVSANAIDITDEAIKRLDATLGSGKN